MSEDLKKVNSEVTADTCEVFACNEEIVARLRQQMPDTKGLAKIFRALADENRLKIVYALSQEARLCVCDVASLTGLSVQAASHHLRLLRDLELARSQKEGKMVYYSLTSSGLAQLIIGVVKQRKED